MQCPIGRRILLFHLCSPTPTLLGATRIVPGIREDILAVLAQMRYGWDASVVVCSTPSSGLPNSMVNV